FDTSFNATGQQVVAPAGPLCLDPTGGIVALGGSFGLVRLQNYGMTVLGTSNNDNISIVAGTQAGRRKIRVKGITQGPVTVSGELFIAGLGGSDTFTVSAGLAGGLVVDGEGGSDTYTVNFGNLAGPVRVLDDGLAGTDTLTVNGTAGNDYIVKDATKVTLGNP